MMPNQRPGQTRRDAIPAANAPVPAGLWRRLGALLYDGLLLLSVLLLATALVLAANRGPFDYTSPAFRLYLLLVGFAFFGGFWTHGGQTLGMRAWRIRLQRKGGDPIGWRQAMVRFGLGLLTLGIGHLWILFDRERRSLYDLASHSRLVRVDRGYVPPDLGRGPRRRI